MNQSDLSGLSRDELEAKLHWYSRRENIYEATERVAHIGHYEWNYELNRLESCSDEYARIFGFSSDKILDAHNASDKVLDQIHPEDRGRYCRVNEEMTVNHYLDVEYRIILDDGEIRNVREINIKIVDATHHKNVGFGIVQDTTHFRKQALEIERRDDLSSQAERLTNIGHFIYNEETEKYVYLSEGFARIYGADVESYTKAKLSVEDDLDDVIEEDRERVREAYRRYMETAEDLDIEYRILRADGEERWLRELTQPNNMKKGRIFHTLGVVQDITRQKEIEKELRDKSILADQAEAITDIGHYLYDEIAQKYLHVSPGLATIYGLDTNFLLHNIHSEKEDMEFVHKEDREMLLDLYYEDEDSDIWEVEYRMVRPDGEMRWVKEIGKKYIIKNGIEEQSIGVIQDITDQKRAEQEIVLAKETLEKEVTERTQQLAVTIKQLEVEIKERKRISAKLHFLANHDSLTGLPSLRLGRDRLMHALAEARRNGQICAIMFLDLDGFKQINDKYGHESGDRVLKAIAECIKAEIRETDTAARIGGDEFIVVLSSIPEVSIIERIASSLIRQIGLPIDIGDAEVCVGASIGISLYPENGSEAYELIRVADKAMYRVKAQGKNHFGFATLQSS